MTIDTLRAICRALPGATEDVKWGRDLAFSVGRKMFAVVDLEPPHSLAFKCSPETFAELVEREGIRPAPYLARAMWIQEQQLGESLERPELEQLIRASYDLVVARLPKARRPDARSARPSSRSVRRSRSARSPSRRRRG